MHVTEVVKVIAREWKALDKEGKDHYKKLAKKDRERFDSEMRQLTTQDGMKPPKKPLTPYMLFVKRHRASVAKKNPHVAKLHIMKIVG